MQLAWRFHGHEPLTKTSDFELGELGATQCPRIIAAAHGPLWPIATLPQEFMSAMPLEADNLNRRE
jgi:hypothetical protein